MPLCVSLSRKLIMRVQGFGAMRPGIALSATPAALEVGFNVALLALYCCFSSGSVRSSVPHEAWQSRTDARKRQALEEELRDFDKDLSTIDRPNVKARPFDKYSGRMSQSLDLSVPQLSRYAASNVAHKAVERRQPRERTCMDVRELGTDAFGTEKSTFEAT